MPHAERRRKHHSNMGEPTVNGETQKSHFISHLTSYPLVSDGITTYKSNPYGQKSIVLFNGAYSRFASPFLSYLRGPYAWVAPYVAKADELGDNGLHTIDNNFPIVKQDTDKIKGSVLDMVFLPVRVAQDGKVYVFKTYEDEGSKIQGKGVLHTAKTIVSTELKIAFDVFNAVAAWLGPKKDAAKNKAEKKADQVHN